MTSVVPTDPPHRAAGFPDSSIVLLKAMLDASPDAIFVKDRGLVYRAANAAFLQLFDKSEDEVIGKTDTDFVSAEEAAVCQAMDRQVFETYEPVISEEWVNTPHGRRCFQVTRTPLRGGGGAIDGVVLLSRDITERLSAEESFRLQAERYATLLTTSSDGFWVMDTKGQLKDVNLAMCTMTGYTRDELMNMRVLDLEANETPEETAAHVEKIIHTGFDRFETRHRIKDGSILDVEISTSFWHPTGEFLVFCRDITERIRVEEHRRQYEAELREARNLAEHESKSKTRFLATASHDLRQPIQAMHLLAHLLVNNELPPASAEIATRLQEAVDGLSDMLAALLDISKLDAGLVEPELSEFSVSELFRQLAVEYRPQAVERGIALQYVGSHVYVRSDLHLLTRILRNLISNAIKYTPSGTVLIGLRRAGECARLQVLDTGIGIAEGEYERIFDEFHQLGNTARDRREGLGLGLAIVKRLASLLGHPVAVVSEPGRGTCFSVQVPLALRREERRHRLPEPGLPMPVPCEGAEILVVDDEADIRKGLEMSLRQWGYAVSVAADFGLAMDVLNEDNPPVLVIADYRLGAETGIEVIQAVRRRTGRCIAALLLTGDATEERTREAERLGVQLLRKPVSAEQLQRAVADCLRSS